MGGGAPAVHSIRAVRIRGCGGSRSPGPARSTLLSDLLYGGDVSSCADGGGYALQPSRQNLPLTAEDEEFCNGQTPGRPAPRPVRSPVPAPAPPRASRAGSSKKMRFNSRDFRAAGDSSQKENCKE
ncbi:hypothetical protein THAOC_34272 [Thalassiosira oceanica]|uniref:Uncharacterized protein n=1 Tax=Thalassiosira oceanica TaxID=159749 RepID=K0R3R6_THAOC|nr:hypothetical protein THAOC_34272 [Thalassiosira oceanica]|eukprot:EJK47035.1 hypothetical protein THAOC_34272 [Thalassiosira oceanica]